MKKHGGLISLPDLVIKLSALSRLDLRKVTIEDIKRSFNQLAEGHIRMTHLVKCEWVFRARKNNDHNCFTNISQLWYPKPEFILQYGRVNDIGKTYFYCAQNQDNALLELRPKVGDVITILRSRLRDPSLWPNVMMCGKLDEKIPVAGPELHNQFKGLSSDKIRITHQHNMALHRFMNKVFRQEIPDNKRHLYKLSIAIAEHLMSSDVIDGIWYPSVAVNKIGDNLALKPQAADHFLIPDHCWMVKILNHIEKDTYGVQCVGTAKSIEANGKINWSFDNLVLKDMPGE